MQKDPTEEDLRSPEFQAIWLAIKDWDISRGDESSTGNRLYAGATGTDVMTIINAVRSIWTCRECHTTKYQKDMKINCCPTHNKIICVNCFQKLHPDDPLFKEGNSLGLHVGMSLEEAAAVVVRAASKCWATPEAAGVFQSERASKIAEELVSYFQSKGPIY